MVRGMKQILEDLFERKLPSMKEIRQLCDLVKEVLSKEQNVLEVKSPITVVGDIHGQFYDLQEMFSVAGKPPETSYLFMGDYVDRGYYSVETLLLLFALKVQFPSRIYLIRGNHETRQITQVYGFYDECMKKLGSPDVWTWCTEAFDCLALAAVVNPGTPEARFAVHAGLTPSCDTIDQIKELDRFVEVPHEGPMCDLLWSDPEDMSGGWGISPRGAGYIFGNDIVDQFNRVNNIHQICRSHQLVMNGYKEYFGDQLVTIWSAPNYCYRCGNIAAVLEVGETQETTNYLKFGPFPSLKREKPQENEENALPDYFL